MRKTVVKLNTKEKTSMHAVDAKDAVATGKYVYIEDFNPPRAAADESESEMADSAKAKKGK